MTLFATSILFLLIVSSAVVAQLPTATILGVVKDATGAVVPDATLTARNVETGQTRTAVTAGDGSYRFSALPVGNYEVRADNPGFRSELRSGLTLTVGQEAVVNFTLEVGGVEQTISVTAEAPLVNTTSGSLGGLVDEQKVADLPLNGRNYIDLTLLQTGVVHHKNTGGTSSMVGSWFSSSGAPIRSNTFLLDGANTSNLFSGTSASITGATLGVEGIREYKVITNSFPAEYGMTMGSQMMIVSKGGTNSFHGSLFEYLRNSALDARNFFDYKTATQPRRLPAFTRNNFGGSFGGPIKRDKTFFYAVYEGVRERLGVTTVLNVIPASAKVDGGLVPQIAPVIKPFLPFFPDPNLPNNQYTYLVSQPSNDDYGQMRLDHTFSNADTMFGRYTIPNATQTKPNNYPQFKTIAAGRSQWITLSENHVFSPTLLNTLRFSYSRFRALFDSPSGISGPQFSYQPGEEWGGASIGGLTGIGGGLKNGYEQDIFTWSDDLFYTRGRHSLKFGALINRYTQYLRNSNQTRGSVSFANLTNFLLAKPTSYTAVTQDSILERLYRFNTLGFYAQDDLRLTSTFTLNLGLRYEFRTDLREVYGNEAVLRDVQHDANTVVTPVPFRNPSLRNLGPRFGFAWDVRGDGRTAVRGGFGLLYDVFNFSSAFIDGMRKPPIVIQKNYVSPPTLTVPFVFPESQDILLLQAIDYNLQQSHMLQYNLTVERQLPFAMALTLAYAGSRGINLFENAEANARIPQILPDGRQFWPTDAPRPNPNWSYIKLGTTAGNSWYNSLQLGLTKRLSKGLQFQSSYTWSKLLDENQGQFSTGDDATGRNILTNPYRRDYSKGPAAFDVAHNWRFNAIYRFPEAVSRGGSLAKVLNGWWMSGILSLQSGYPFTTTLNTNRSRAGVLGSAGGIDRPDLVPGVKAQDITHGVSRGCGNIPAGTPVGTVERWYDPCAFTIQPAGFMGTEGRNILRGPGFANLDFSLAKDTALGFLGESGKLEFRAEFFNILNRANFSLPGLGVYTASRDVENPVETAGRITRTATTSRQMQLALKIVF